jgi:epsilon-lactone hydrolase
MTPSFTARAIAAIFRFTGTFRKRYAGGPDFLSVIAKSRLETPQLPTTKMRAAIDVSETQFEGRSIWQFAPKDQAATAHMLYWHGGGYIYPPADVHWAFFAHLSQTYGLAITVPLYPLAPEACAEETVNFARALYQDFIARRDGPFIMAGDSAGGGLAAALAQSARDAGERQAAGLVLICPWLDGSVSHPDQPKIEPRDCILMIQGTRDAAKLYARDLPVSDPRISPIHGNWEGLPPILAYGGGDDILVTDARALKATLPAIEYHEGAGLMHDWPLFFLRESRAAQAEIAKFAQKLVQS